jgi:hypothetical protein
MELALEHHLKSPLDNRLTLDRLIRQGKDAGVLTQIDSPLSKNGDVMVVIMTTHTG